MTHIVTERCVDCRYLDCLSACPVDCFYLVEDPAMLVINPDECIDCTACIPECPVHAIYAEDELPAEYAEWLPKNAALAAGAAAAPKDADVGGLPGALTLEQVQAREKGRGWVIEEPPHS